MQNNRITRTYSYSDGHVAIPYSLSIRRLLIIFTLVVRDDKFTYKYLARLVNEIHFDKRL